MRMMQLRARQLDPAQPIGAMQVDAVDVVLDGESSADPWPARRINLFDDGMDVSGCLLGGHVAGTGADGQDVEFRVKQRESQGECAIDTRIADANDLARHDRLSSPRRHGEVMWMIPD